MLKKAAPDYNPNTNALVASNPPHTATTHGQTENVYLNMTNTSTNPAPNGSTTSNINPLSKHNTTNCMPHKVSSPNNESNTLQGSNSDTPIFTNRISNNTTASLNETLGASVKNQ